MPDRLLSEPAAALRIGWSAANLRARRRRLVDDPKSDAAPEHMRVGGAVRYREIAVTRWLRRHPQYQNRCELLRTTLTQSQVCDLLGIGRSTLRACRSRFITDPASDAAPEHLQVGQEIRYRKSDVQAWIHRQDGAATTGRD